MTIPWNGWDTEPPILPPALRDLVDAMLGDRPPAASEPVPESAVKLQPSALPPGVRHGLAAVVGDAHIDDSDAARLRHTRGKSTVDLVRIRGGDASDAPDAVVLPASSEEVLAILRTCADNGVAVVPYGGGTSVVGGLTAERAPTAAAIALDLRRLNRLVAVDPPSRLAVLEAGVPAPLADELLGAHGLTLGHVPQSYEYATIGGFAATRSAGHASLGNGRFDAMVAGLTVVTPRGILRTGVAPASAAGPDLRQLFLGSEGAFGVITEVTVRVRPVPEVVRHEAWTVPGFDAGIDAVRALVQQRPTPAIVRLSDDAEAAANAGVGLIIGYAGSAGEVADQRAAVARVFEPAGATPLGTEPGEAWLAQRYHGPRLRDALLTAGLFTETLETATWWSGLPALYRAVRGALLDRLTVDGRAPLVLCHVSHPYETGASLYFTIAAAADPGIVPRWAAAKAATLTAIHAAGGTVTHHHGVGRDHVPGYRADLGETGVELLRAIKRHLDPAGILNPGVLVP
jgi:alkyldihydroxyacetonephosphate synthase